MPAARQTDRVPPVDARDGKLVLGYSVAPVTLPQAARRVLELARARAPHVAPHLVVTLNPEIVVQARQDAALHQAIESAELIVADGVGILWAARRAGVALPGRVPGVELVEHVLREGGTELRVFFLGARPGVAERAAAAAHQRFGTEVAGTHHGYFRRPEDVPEVTARVRDAAPDLLLAGMGAGQERFLVEHGEALAVPVAIGVGGTLDVLAGEARRTPTWTRRLNLEWAWRVGLDPKRWHRIPRLLHFAVVVLRSPGGRGAGGT